MVALFFVAMMLPRTISECKCESFFGLTSWTKMYFSDNSKTGCPENFLNPRTARVPAVTLETFSRFEPNGHHQLIVLTSNQNPLYTNVNPLSTKTSFFFKATPLCLYV